MLCLSLNSINIFHLTVLVGALSGMLDRSDGGHFALFFSYLKEEAFCVLPNILPTAEW